MYISFTRVFLSVQKGSGGIKPLFEFYKSTIEPCEHTQRDREPPVGHERYMLGSFTTIP